LSDP
jgi:5'-3' exoribonuclease 2